jgi:co-chaperonin GroES (HSP10)
MAEQLSVALALNVTVAVAGTCARVHRDVRRTGDHRGLIVGDNDVERAHIGVVRRVGRGGRHRGRPNRERTAARMAVGHDGRAVVGRTGTERHNGLAVARIRVHRDVRRTGDHRGLIVGDNDVERAHIGVVRRVGRGGGDRGRPQQGTHCRSHGCRSRWPSSCRSHWH